ncbi:MAG: hypothetical protein JNK15_22510 [Planctomycetes bacterium]|nr:hypothetical protein [Planctomycetota bacterium]
MHHHHVLGAAVAIALAGLCMNLRRGDATAAPVPPAPPRAEGHFVLVVEGDRDALGITHASRKEAPWAGIPKGFASTWTLTVHDAAGEVLAEVPLDVSPFALRADEKGTLAVVGCMVRDAKVGMLVSVPAFAAAATYRFSRPGDAGGRQELGTVAGDAVRALAGGGR